MPFTPAGIYMLFSTALNEFSERYTEMFYSSHWGRITTKRVNQSSVGTRRKNLKDLSNETRRKTSTQRKKNKK